MVLIPALQSRELSPVIFHTHAWCICSNSVTMPTMLWKPKVTHLLLVCSPWTPIASRYDICYSKKVYVLAINMLEIEQLISVACFLWSIIQQWALLNPSTIVIKAVWVRRGKWDGGWCTHNVIAKIPPPLADISTRKGGSPVLGLRLSQIILPKRQ